jgi:hypothetical protein
MSGITRRSVIGGATLVGGLAVIPVSFPRSAPALHIFDSRLVASRSPARAFHDIANEDAALWRATRNLLVSRGDRVSGVTCWSDWIAIRGLLSERGLRTQRFKIEGHISFWEMR